jgi:hypothetical protein
MYVGPVQVDGPLDGQLVRIENDGTAHRAQIARAYGDGAMPSLLQSHLIGFGAGGREVRHGQELCVIADGTPVSITRALPQALGVTERPYYVLLTYHAWRPAALAVTTDSGSGFPPADHEMPIDPGAERSISWLGEADPHGVMLVVPAQNTVCISRLDVVSLRNAG